jgi:hypothetical protein
VYETPTAAQAALLDVVRRDPRQLGVARTRWRWADLLTTCAWLRLGTPRGVGSLLARLGISYQRGRQYVPSPDPDYAAKRAYLAAQLAAARTSGGRIVALYLDELTYYRQPTLAPAYAGHGETPRAQRSHRSNTATRVLATLADDDGRVVAQQSSKIGIAALVQFYQELRTHYPAAARFVVAQDNWPVHFHPDLRVALEPQESPFPRCLPPDWRGEASPAARRRWGELQLPIQLVPLPTYASWLNPIEKLWRWLQQEVIHLHPWADDLPTLRAAVRAFLGRFAAGSQALRRYVGLCPD